MSLEKLYQIDTKYLISGFKNERRSLIIVTCEGDKVTLLDLMCGNHYVCVDFNYSRKRK